MAYSVEAKIRAQTLYCEQGLSFELVAEETSVSLSQLKKWAKAGDWATERQDQEAELLELSALLRTTKLNLARKAADTGHPQDIYALSNLLKATAPQRTALQPVDKASLVIDIMGAFIAYLSERDGEALHSLEPHLRGFAEHIKTEAAA